MTVQFAQREAGSKRMVIMGCGWLGAYVASTLSEQGHSVHILDVDREAFERLPASAISDGRIVPIIGDGTVHRDLVNAAVQDADVFIALTGRDSMNALAGQTARHIYHVPQVICRIDDPTRQEMYDELGLVAVSATALAREMVVRAATV